MAKLFLKTAISGSKSVPVAAERGKSNENALSRQSVCNAR